MTIESSSVRRATAAGRQPKTSFPSLAGCAAAISTDETELGLTQAQDLLNRDADAIVDPCLPDHLAQLVAAVSQSLGAGKHNFKTAGCRQGVALPDRTHETASGPLWAKPQLLHSAIDGDVRAGR